MQARHLASVLIGAYLGGRLIARRRRRLELRGASALITGGSRGLGLVLARELVAAGARVAILARTAADLEAARRELAAMGGDVIAIACDVSDRDDVVEAIELVLARRGGIDLLINNAGQIQVGPLEHMTADDFEQALGVHFRGPLHTMLAVIPSMRARGGGRIVNIASFGGKIAVPHMAPYSASKFALCGLSDAFRAELAADGIHVTTVCPWLMRTGSHVNIEVRGRHAAEWAWMAAGSAAPGSLDPRRAARRILRAARDGEPALDLGRTGRALIAAAALAPGKVAGAMALFARLLPPPAGAPGDRPRTGWDSHSRVAPSLLTRRADREIPRNNELRGHRRAAAMRR